MQINDIQTLLSAAAVNLRVEDLYQKSKALAKPGPWREEPDSVTWYDPNRNLLFVTRRHPVFGHWCGYVGIPAEHPLVDQDDLYVHGGVTCNSTELKFYKPQEPEPIVIKWLGFDCNHYMDYGPFDEFGDDTSEEYRDLTYVINELLDATQPTEVAAVLTPAPPNPAVPSAEFLTTLTHYARTYGWSGDYVEVRRFVEDLYDQAELPLPDLEAYPYDEPTTNKVL